MIDVVQSANHEWRPFRCEVIPERNVVRVEPLGEIDLATAPTVAQVLDDLRATGFRQVVLDLKGVTFIDSTGMRAVVDARRAAVRDGADLMVLPGPPAVQRSFELTGLAPLVFTLS